jgi:DNA-binding protein HU-beta/integration host factor subunit alpha
LKKTLTKLDIVRSLADRYRLPYAETQRVVQGTLDMIIDALIQGKTVELRNFGVFETVERKSRVARNPKAHVELTIPARRVVRFRQGKIMDEEITAPSMKGRIKPRAESDESPRASDQGPA